MATWLVGSPWGLKNTALWAKFEEVQGRLRGTTRIWAPLLFCLTEKAMRCKYIVFFRKKTTPTKPVPIPGKARAGLREGTV
jgi:hypothetical protein